MAKLIDTDGTVVAETTEFDELVEQGAHEEPEAAEEVVEEVVEAPVEEPEEDDLPDKYKGKSAAEIAKMHRELESRLGQQSQEVGELRRAFDDMVQKSIEAQNSPTPEPEVEEVDFFADPSAAVKRAIDNHPSLKQAQAVAAEMAKSQSLAKLQAAHPDMNEVLAEDGFREWVGKSTFRQQMYKQADEQYDFEAANELLTLYKDRKGVVSQTQKVEKVAQKQAVKKASTGSSRSSAQGSAPKKTYRRADIIELMKTNPKRYEALSDEIMRAYAEGRVK